MGEQRFRVFLLQLDHAGVEVVGDGFGEAEAGGVLNAVGFLEGAGDVEVEVNVDAALFQLGDEEIEPVEAIRIEVAAVGKPRVDDAARRALIQVMNPHAVDAEERQVRRYRGGIFPGGQTGDKGEVHPPDAERLAVRAHDVSAGRPQEAG